MLPTGDGTTWEYEVTGSAAGAAQPRQLTVRVTGREQVIGKDLLKLETLEDGKLIKVELVAVEAGGFLCYRRIPAGGKTTNFEPPQTIVPLPLAVGAEWELDDPGAGHGMQRWTVAAEEAVIVPAGNFRAFRLHCEQPGPLSITIDRWFVAGTGFVREITTTRAPAGRLVNRVTSSLTKFSPAAVTPRPIPTPTSVAAPMVTATPTASPENSEALPAAASSTEPSPQAAPDTAAVASPSPALRVKLEVSEDPNGPAGTEFRSDIANIFVRWAGENLPVNSGLRVAWIAEDVGDVAPPNFVVDQTETVVTSANFGARFTLSRPSDGWAAGRYRVELYLEDELIEMVRVTIND